MFVLFLTYLGEIRTTQLKKIITIDQNKTYIYFNYLEIKIAYLHKLYFWNETKENVKDIPITIVNLVLNIIDLWVPLYQFLL